MLAKGREEAPNPAWKSHEYRDLSQTYAESQAAAAERSLSSTMFVRV